MTREELIEGIMQAVVNGVRKLAANSPKNVRRRQTQAYFDKHLKGAGGWDRAKRLSTFAANRGKPLTQMKALRGGSSLR